MQIRSNLLVYKCFICYFIYFDILLKWAIIVVTLLNDVEMKDRPSTMYGRDFLYLMCDDYCK